MLWSCNEDDKVIQNEEDIDEKLGVILEESKLNLSVTNGEHLKESNPQVYNKLNELDQSNFRKGKYSKAYNFHYQLDNIQTIENDSFIQYTIFVETEYQKDDEMLNYTIKYDKKTNKTIQFLTTYYYEGGVLSKQKSRIEYLDGESLFRLSSSPGRCADGSVPELVDITTEYITRITMRM